MSKVSKKTKSSNALKPMLAVAFYPNRYVDSFKPTHEQIKYAVLLLKNKERISVKEIQDAFNCDWNWAHTMMDLLEQNTLVSDFIGEKERIVLVGNEILKRQILVENFEDFDI